MNTLINKLYLCCDNLIYREVALEKGYQMIDVECSSLFSAKAVEKCGFECIYSMPYSDYKDEKGEVVFKTQPPHNDIKIYVLPL